MYILDGVMGSVLSYSMQYCGFDPNQFVPKDYSIILTFLGFP